MNIERYEQPRNSPIRESGKKRHNLKTIREMNSFIVFIADINIPVLLNKVQRIRGLARHSVFTI